MSDKYILRGHDAVPCDDLFEWGRWLETNNRHVADDRVGNVRVSTVFLGLDQSFDMGDRPVLFETMIFGGTHDGDQWRYSTWDEAEAGHASALKLATESR